MILDCLSSGTGSIPVSAAKFNASLLDHKTHLRAWSLRSISVAKFNASLRSSSVAKFNASLRSSSAAKGLVV
jgi:hypothetical protein